LIPPKPIFNANWSIPCRCGAVDTPALDGIGVNDPKDSVPPIQIENLIHAIRFNSEFNWSYSYRHNQII
jgi:hypothetical protein